MVFIDIFRFLDLNTIFDTFLPQLLEYPNPLDPLNSTAAYIFMNEPQKFNKIVKCCFIIKLYYLF